jgi:hypothetical protein
MPPPRVKAAEKMIPPPAEPVAPVVLAPDVEPKMNPMQGIKTPAYRAWLKVNQPEEYRRKFGEE